MKAERRPEYLQDRLQAEKRIYNYKAIGQYIVAATASILTIDPGVDLYHAALDKDTLDAIRAGLKLGFLGAVAGVTIKGGNEFRRRKKLTIDTLLKVKK